jgi:hypothetical protein
MDTNQVNASIHQNNVTTHTKNKSWIASSFLYFWKLIYSWRFCTSNICCILPFTCCHSSWKKILGWCWHNCGISSIASWCGAYICMFIHHHKLAQSCDKSKTIWCWYRCLYTRLWIHDQYNSSEWYLLLELDWSQYPFWVCCDPGQQFQCWKMLKRRG